MYIQRNWRDFWYNRLATYDVYKNKIVKNETHRTTLQLLNAIATIRAHDPFIAEGAALIAKYRFECLQNNKSEVPHECTHVLIDKYNALRKTEWFDHPGFPKANTANFLDRCYHCYTLITKLNFLAD